MRNQTSDLWIPHSDALPLSHRDSMVSEVCYEVHMTHALHTARISNVNSIMFVVRNKRDGKYELSKEIKNDVFLSCHKHGTKKNDRHCLQATLVN